MWAAETAPPSHGSLLRSGGWAIAGSISRSCPLLLAAPEMLVAPSCLGAGGETKQGPRRVLGVIMSLWLGLNAACMDAKNKNIKKRINKKP